MNAMRDFITAEKPSTEKQENISLANSGAIIEKKEAEKMTKEYLDEKLYYFYTNGGPVMDI